MRRECSLDRLKGDSFLPAKRLTAGRAALSKAPSSPESAQQKKFSRPVSSRIDYRAALYAARYILTQLSFLASWLLCSVLQIPRSKDSEVVREMPG